MNDDQTADQFVKPPSRPVLADLLAGLSVAMVLVPQSMAYAELAGLPSHLGLFASALPPILAALFASSPYLQTGPVALTSLLTFGALAGLAEIGSADYIAMAALLALLVGTTRLLLGLLRLGIVTYLMRDPVVTGFTSAAAILILASQLPKALGVVAPNGGVLWQAGWSLSNPSQWELTSVAIATVTLGLVLAGRQVIHRLFPGALLAVVGGIAISRLTNYDGPVVGDVPTGLPSLSLNLPWGSTGSLLVGSVLIALVGYAEPASIARVFATQDGQRWSADREFVSQGVANIASAVSGSFPVGGSFSRSSLNRMAGAQTRWSGLFTGAAVLAFLPFANVLGPLPRATLGGVVIAAVIGLVRPVALVATVRRSPADALVAWSTFAATLALAPQVEQGVLVGILLSLAVGLRTRRAVGQNRRQS
ncbi:MAG: SulP family inorganic anion transporter [Acidimicrobiales bacterium]|nr:SulP family inorganic anion transporter [Acidimicrobiales bacterium]